MAVQLVTLIPVLAQAGISLTKIILEHVATLQRMKAAQTQEDRDRIYDEAIQRQSAAHTLVLDAIDQKLAELSREETDGT